MQLQSIARESDIVSPTMVEEIVLPKRSSLLHSWLCHIAVSAVIYGAAYVTVSAFINPQF